MLPDENFDVKNIKPCHSYNQPNAVCQKLKQITTACVQFNILFARVISIRFCYLKYLLYAKKMELLLTLSAQSLVDSHTSVYEQDVKQTLDSKEPRLLTLLHLDSMY